MTAVTYTAVRGLMSGVTAGTSVSLTLDLAARVPDRKRIGKEVVSLGGRRQYLHHRTELGHRFQTIAMAENSAAAQALRQFLQSIERGEVFNLDITGTASVPVSPVPATLDGDWRENIERYRPTLVSFTFTLQY